MTRQRVSDMTLEQQIEHTLLLAPLVWKHGHRVLVVTEALRRLGYCREFVDF